MFEYSKIFQQAFSVRSISVFCRFRNLNVLILSKPNINRTEKCYAYESRQSAIFQYNILVSYIFLSFIFVKISSIYIYDSYICQIY